MAKQKPIASPSPRTFDDILEIAGTRGCYNIAVILGCSSGMFYTLLKKILPCIDIRLSSDTYSLFLDFSHCPPLISTSLLISILKRWFLINKFTFPFYKQQAEINWENALKKLLFYLLLWRIFENSLVHFLRYLSNLEHQIFLFSFMLFKKNII